MKIVIVVFKWAESYDTFFYPCQFLLVVAGRIFSNIPHESYAQIEKYIVNVWKVFIILIILESNVLRMYCDFLRKEFFKILWYENDLRFPVGKKNSTVDIELYDNTNYNSYYLRDHIPTFKRGECLKVISGQTN